MNDAYRRDAMQLALDHAAQAGNLVRSAAIIARFIATGEEPAA